MELLWLAVELSNIFFHLWWGGDFLIWLALWFEIGLYFQR
jgi:hypothetical protein